MSLSAGIPPSSRWVVMDHAMAITLCERFHLIQCLSDWCDYTDVTRSVWWVGVVTGGSRVPSTNSVRIELLDLSTFEAAIHKQASLPRSADCPFPLPSVPPSVPSSVSVSLFLSLGPSVPHDTPRPLFLPPSLRPCLHLFPSSSFPSSSPSSSLPPPFSPLSNHPSLPPSLSLPCSLDHSISLLFLHLSYF